MYAFLGEKDFIINLIFNYRINIIYYEEIIFKCWLYLFKVSFFCLLYFNLLVKLL